MVRFHVLTDNLTAQQNGRKGGTYDLIDVDKDVPLENSFFHNPHADIQTSYQGPFGSSCVSWKTRLLLRYHRHHDLLHFHSPLPLYAADRALYHLGREWAKSSACPYSAASQETGLANSPDWSSPKAVRGSSRTWHSAALAHKTDAGEEVCLTAWPATRLAVGGSKFCMFFCCTGVCSAHGGGLRVASARGNVNSQRNRVVK